MSERKRFIKLIPLFSLLGVVMLTCVLLIVSGIANPFISSFAVDSEERLYIGLQGRIEVYDGNSKISTINPKTSRSYVFTILEDDTILLSTSTTVYSMELNGNILDSWEDHGAQTYNDIQYSNLQYISRTGDRYTLDGILGWSRITKNDTVVMYSISVISFLVKVMLLASIVCLFSIVILLIKDRIAALKTAH